MSFAEIETVLRAQLRGGSAQTFVEVIYSRLGLSRCQVIKEFLECSGWSEFTFSEQLDSFFLLFAKDSGSMKDVSHLHVLRAGGGGRGAGAKQDFPHLHNAKRLAIGSGDVLWISPMRERLSMKLIVLLFDLS